MMKTLNDYRAMSYRMEIAEDKDEGGICGFLSRFAWLYYLWRNYRECISKRIGRKTGVA